MDLTSEFMLIICIRTSLKKAFHIINPCMGNIYILNILQGSIRNGALVCKGSNNIRNYYELNKNIIKTDCTPVAPISHQNET